ncbi:hypothetical protein ACP275_01G034800 [Erythranthe tilingii]
MRGKSSSSKSKNGVPEISKSEKPKEPHLSGAYIRSLVKQLSSSRTKDSSSSKEPDELEGDRISTCDGFSDQKQEKSQPPQQHKKQVRRRLHTSRPYQERLLNMAEARREIVTALKFHRAAMKQAGENQPQQQQQQIESRPEIHQLSTQEQEAKSKSRRNPRIYASNSPTSNNFPPGYFENLPYHPSPYSWPISSIAQPPPPPPPPPLQPPYIQENLNFILPSQTLGLNLNLNLQDFNNMDSTFYYTANNHSSIYSSSTPSTSSSPFSATTDEIQYTGVPPAEVAEFGDSGLHHAMDDDEMAEIRSIGEQYQMEWNDTLNLVNSAWWFKFLKAMEISPENQEEGGHRDFLNCPFDEAVEFPDWLNANESCLQHVNDFCSDNYFQDPALPCMEIEEIEGMDGDWLA